MLKKTTISLPQSMHIESNQSVTFKTQLGEKYGQNTGCKVVFKVSATLNVIILTVAHFISENKILSILGGVLP